MAASFGLIDPLRNGVQEIVLDLHQAGTNTRIISGDHKESAIFTARQIGIMENDSDVGAISGKELS